MDRFDEQPVPKPLLRYTHYDLEEQPAGVIVEVTLSAVNNVRLMTEPNFQRFKEVLDFKYVGGIAKVSPALLVVPEAGHWHVVVDQEGHHGLADSQLKILTSMPKRKRSKKAA